MKFGAHCSTAGGFYRALQRCRQIGGECCQIFVKNNMQWLGRLPFADELARYSQELSEGGIAAVFGHAGYLINLAAPPGANRDKSLECMILELRIAAALKLPFLVVHPGAHVGAGEELGLERTVEALNLVLNETRKVRVRIALENTAGQGSCLGHKLAHLAGILQTVRNPERVGVCLDTAHLFAAGYDIRTQKGVKATLKEVSSLVGLNQVLAFHLNDSKSDLGSRVDRHAHIGEGKIGLEGFRALINDSRLKYTPGCLETPKSKDLAEDIENLGRLRALAQGAAAPGNRCNRTKRYG